jgi:cobalt/nickel transport system permease protein
MHISEGILSWPVLATGASVAAVGVGIGLRRMQAEQVPRVAVLTSAFFVASLVHLPVGVGSAHLILNGLMGVLLGWAAFPALLVALFLQAVLFQFGGLTTLGVNTVTMGLPAVLCYYLLNAPIRRARVRWVVFACGFGAGMLGVGLAAVLTGAVLLISGESLRRVGELVVLAHVPVMAVEGLVCGWICVLLRQVQPRVLAAQ